MKKQEIFNKLKQIQEITGNKTVGFEEIDLETEFDPEDYDQKMQNVFSESYYDGDENEKPVFDDDIDTADYELEDDNDDENGSSVEDDDEAGQQPEEAEVDDEAYPPEYDNGGESYEGYNDQEYYDESYDYDQGGDEEEVLMDADYLPGGENYGKPLEKKKKETKKEKAQREKEEKRLAKQQARANGSTDPAAIRTAVAAIGAARSVLDSDKQKRDFNSYLDEYYQLDYEDMVGDLPTRFKYHKVKPSAFGLTPVEILLADDKDLNEFVSLKKFAPYRRSDEQEEDIRKYGKKNRVQMFRHKLKSQIKDQELDKDWDPIKRRKKELERREREEKAALKKGQDDEEEEGESSSKKSQKKKNKAKKRKSEDTDDDDNGKGKDNKEPKAEDSLSRKKQKTDGAGEDMMKDKKDKKEKKEKKEKKDKKEKKEKKEKKDKE
ncbi:KRRI-Interacting protein 1 [Gamsiella multidivaricata]|nr:KRRI-Interacting protein 1 [Gamsiella multidivaricata]